MELQYTNVVGVSAAWSFIAGAIAVVAASSSAGAAVMLNWAAKLGKEHSTRAHMAELAARTEHDAAEEMATQCLERWTPIVAAMTRIVGTYNIAFAGDVLDIVDNRSDPNRPVVTIHAGADAAVSLRAAVE